MKQIKARQKHSNIQANLQDKKAVKSAVLEKNVENSRILTRDEVVDVAKKFGNNIVSGIDALDYNNGNVIYDYVAIKLGYDALPQSVDSATFEKLKGDSPIGVIYRGIVADTKQDALKYADTFKRGKMYAGKSYAHGSGTYFTPDLNYAESYNPQGVMLRAVLDKTAKIVDYKAVMKEYSDTGADVAKWKKGNDTEAWEDILSSVGEYAAIKGYDAINMNGAFGEKHIIVLNRGKVIIEE